MGTVRTPRATEAQGVTFIELFFDLVFVFAVTQVTVELHHHLDLKGVVHAVIVFWLVWWAWTQFTWTLNTADTEHPGVELLTMGAVAAAFFMALSVPDIWTPRGWWFSVAYVLVRLIGISGQWWISSGDDAWRAAVRRWSTLSAVGLAFVLVGGYVPIAWRTAFLGVAVLLDVYAASQASKGRWRQYPAHFAERHGLFVIIVLGESLIAAGLTANEVPRTATLAAVLVPAVAATGALWWTYFDWAKGAIEHGLNQVADAGTTAAVRDTYSFLHFPIIGGVIGFAIAVEEGIAHPGDNLETAVIAALVIGCVMFVGGTGLAVRRMGTRPNGARAAGCVAIVAVSPLLVRVPAGVALAIVAVILVATAWFDVDTRVGPTDDADSGATGLGSTVVP